MEIELKPCPFCGSKNIGVCVDQWFAWYAYCEECGATIEGFSNEGHAIDAWNTRAGETNEK